ncbi:MAG: hypothetical protein AAF850_00550 [Pseudomonadota bacterium]
MTVSKIIKTAVAGFALAFGAVAIAFASGAAPDNYEDAARDYVVERLSNPAGARVRFESEPYEVFADIGRYEGVAGWAVDVRVRTRLANGEVTRFQPYTIIFVDGDPVALRSDLRKMTRA